MSDHKQQLRDLGLAVVQTEKQAIEALEARINDDFVKACELCLSCRGRIVVTGMGKSGHIGSKLAATLASTGSPAFFVHPGEASHGDLGMITPEDVVIAISNSGETDELLTILPIIKRLGVPMISMTGNPASSLASEAEVNLDISVEKEACPLGLAPTSSTTATLVMGDALAIALLESRGFTADDFARSHPGGRLGRRLLLHVGDIMHKGDELPMFDADTMLDQALLEISRKGLGMTTIVNPDNTVTGVYTDGDLRRSLDQQIDVHQTTIGEVMTREFRSATEDMLAVEALKLMDDYRINALPVLDADNKLVGCLNMHDLLRSGVV
ncbi:MAG: KpsF/GutQ family sugar-phosphate isomerase [Gammaproteobacteria bacterium]|nr:KpsF/GutQ family sugar-phosphate isomerase [Gammaproteobacteria bacterium]